MSYCQLALAQAPAEQERFSRGITVNKAERNAPNLLRLRKKGSRGRIDLGAKRETARCRQARNRRALGQQTLDAASKSDWAYKGRNSALTILLVEAV